MAMQVEKVVKKAYGMLAFIGQGIEFKNWQVHRSLKVASQVEKVVNKAYGILAFIGRGIEYKRWGSDVAVV